MIRDPNFHKKPNLTLEHLIFILKVKYGITIPTTPDHTPAFFTDHTFHGPWRRPTQGATLVTEENEQHVEEEQSLHPPRLLQSSLDVCLDCLQSSMDRLKIASNHHSHELAFIRDSL